MLLFTVRGTATMYYGDELGLQPMELSEDKMRDPSGRDNPLYSRDHSRSPMPWKHGPGNGFTGGDPWLPIDEMTSRLNVDNQRNDPKSLFNFYRKILQLRNEYRELQDGDYWPIDTEAPILAFYRGTLDRKLLVAMNIGDSHVSFNIHDLHAKQILSTEFDHQNREIYLDVNLRPREGIIAVIAMQDR